MNLYTYIDDLVMLIIMIMLYSAVYSVLQLSYELVLSLLI